MKRIVGLFLLTLCLSLWMYAADSDTPMQITGTICNSHCVKYGRDVSTCNTDCTVTEGDAVFINDTGLVKKIKNQDMCTEHVGKHVTMMAIPMEQNGEQWINIQQLNEDAH